MLRNEEIEELDRIFGDYDRSSLEKEFGDAKLEIEIGKENLRFKVSSPERSIYYQELLKKVAKNYGYDSHADHKNIYSISDKKAGLSCFVLAETTGAED